MANKKKTRYRKGGPARLDMRQGGRISKFAGGVGDINIDIPEVDVQLTPEEEEAIRLANAPAPPPPPLITHGSGSASSANHHKEGSWSGGRI